MKLSRKLGRWLRRGKVGDPAVGPSRKVYSRSFAQKTYSPIHHIHIEVPGVKHTTFFGPLTTKQRGNHHQNVSVPAPQEFASFFKYCYPPVTVTAHAATQLVRPVPSLVLLLSQRTV